MIFVRILSIFIVLAWFSVQSLHAVGEESLCNRENGDSEETFHLCRTRFEWLHEAVTKCKAEKLIKFMHEYGVDQLERMFLNWDKDFFRPRLRIIPGDKNEFKGFVLKMLKMLQGIVLEGYGMNITSSEKIAEQFEHWESLCLLIKSLTQSNGYH